MIGLKDQAENRLKVEGKPTRSLAVEGDGEKTRKDGKVGRLLVERRYGGRW